MEHTEDDKGMDEEESPDDQGDQGEPEEEEAACPDEGEDRHEAVEPWKTGKNRARMDWMRGHYLECAPGGRRRGSRS